MSPPQIWVYLAQHSLATCRFGRVCRKAQSCCVTDLRFSGQDKQNAFKGHLTLFAFKLMAKTFKLRQETESNAWCF